MTVPVGKEVYNVDTTPVVARGVLYNQAELDFALQERVRPIIHDDHIEAREMLARCAKTKFALSRVQAILATPKTPPEDWRVGEALAEAYLSDHCNCIFPWPGGRDLKNSSASPAGTDLVGFQRQGVDFRFAFGEVKTSYHAEWPPSIVTGRHGLAEQLSTLRNSETTRDELVAYLAHHSTRADWRTKYESAAIAYLVDSTDVALFGVLVRDVEPKPADLRARARDLAKDCPAKTSIELRAIYLPSGSIVNLPRAV